MTDFSTWDRATLEQFAQEATDKLVADLESKEIQLQAAETWIEKMNSEIDELRKAQGEPVAEVVSYDQAGLYDELPLGTLLYTSSPTIPEGWQLVPVEPTEEMTWAAIVAADEKPLSDWGKIVDLTYDETYVAMLAAAPKHKESE